MDYKKLANILYPNLKLDYEYYMNLYKNRGLSENAQVTRFAPSPTGFVHIGGLFQCVINSFVAKQSNGVFYLRLEDTDSKREVEKAGDIAYNSLVYFDLKPDEGYCGDNLPEIGNYGPYIQSQRVDIYKAFAKRLVELGRAYPCFCKKTESIEEIEENRAEQLSNNNEQVIDVCRNLDIDEIEKRINNGEQFALRLKSNMLDKYITINDAIKGQRKIPANKKDIIIMKSNSIPPYAFAHLVDDTLMQTTVVVRGEDWYQSVPAHIELFESFGFDAPNYCHTPVLCKLEGDKKRKLSKRKDPEADCRYYINNGYPVKALLSYLTNIANSDFEDWQKNNIDKDIFDFPFSINKIGSNNPIFDVVKLNDISKNIISQMSAEQVYDCTLEWAKNFDKEFYEYLLNNADYCTSILAVDRGGKNSRKDLINFASVKNEYFYMFSEFKGIDINLLSELNLSNELIVNIMNNYANIFEGNDDKNQWFEKIKQLAPDYNFCTDNKEYKLNSQNYNGNVATLCTLIRICILGVKNSPDMHLLFNLIGKDEIKRRINILHQSLGV